MKNLIALFVVLTMSIFLKCSSCDAAMIVAYAHKVDESYTVDTSTIYNPDKNHINVGVYYSDNLKKSTSPYVFKYQFINNQWRILEKKSNKDVDDIQEDANHYWARIDPNSIAQDVLRVIIPYMK